MSAVEIRKVESRRDLQTFIDFHYDLYEGNEYDVPNLYTDEVNTLRKDKNAAFEFCDAEYYMAYKDGRLVGRVAAIINNRANERWNRKSVRFGWIDFIDDREVSAALLKAVEDYGRSHGMTEVVGPLGFTDMDPEGMLTEGFDQLGTMATIYNYPYYPEHIEAQDGWIVDNKYVEYKILVPDTMPDRHAKLAKMIQRRYNLRVKKVTKKDIFEGGYGRKIFELINTTYADLYGFSQLTDRQIDQYINMYFPPCRPQPHHTHRGRRCRQQARGSWYHHPFTCLRIAQVQAWTSVPVRMDTRFARHQAPQDQHRRPTACRRAARISLKGSQRAALLRPHSTLSEVRIRVGRVAGRA